MTELISEKSYAIDSTYANFYTGGDLWWSADGEHMFCYNTKEITRIEVATGQTQGVYTLNDSTDPELENDDTIYAFTVSLNSEHLATAHRSGLLRLWSVETGKVLKLWKGQHKGPIVKVHFSPCGRVLCSSGADSTLRLWDFMQSRCLAVLRDYPGPAQVLSFHPKSTRTEIFAVGADNAIYCWDYQSKQLLHQLRGHLSAVTAISFDCNRGENNDSQHMVSVSRDKVLIVWRLSDGKQLKVIPMYEELEGVCWLPVAVDQPDLLVASGNGTLRLVHSESAKISSLTGVKCCEIKQLLYCKKKKAFAVVTAEQNIFVYKRQTSHQVECIKQMVGFTDEVLDLCFLGADDRYLVVATNSKNLKVYDTVSNMNCKLFAGHKDTVITLSTAGGNSNLLLSSGKDYTILLWQLRTESDEKDGTFDLVCVSKKDSCHTSTIGSLAFGHNNTKMFASVCQDGSMKVWHLNPSNQQPSSSMYTFELRYAVIAHDKEVNCVCFSTNNKLIATASQDKTVKLWSSEQQATIGCLRGHTRGVWCVRFSTVDQVVLTSSADCSLRLWSLATLTCLKRFEQECSILRAEFIDHSKYIITAGSDGLVKTWNIKTGTCVQTLDGHNDRIWALAVSQRTHKYFYTGGADSKIVRWRDTTKEQRNMQIEQRQANLEQEQSLQNLLRSEKNINRALAMALNLGKPKTSYDILKRFVRQRNPVGIKNVIESLSDDQRRTLLDHAKVWNTNSRHAQVANVVLQHLLRDALVNPTQRVYNTQNVVESLMPYEQRHFKRLTETQKDLAFLEFVVGCM